MSSQDPQMAAVLYRALDKAKKRDLLGLLEAQRGGKLNELVMKHVPQDVRDSMQRQQKGLQVLPYPGPTQL
jgi:hypothetical protein